MQYASSLRFAGLLLDAQECDYTDFVNQGLLCPICKGTVFLVAGSRRDKHSRKTKDGGTVSVKESTVPAHFSHHTNDRTLIADCELRSAKITPMQRQASQAQARGQIARIFRQKFWSMTKTSIKLTDIDSTRIILADLWSKASLKQPLASKAQMETLVNMLADSFAHPAQLDHTKRDMQTAIERWAAKVQARPEEIPLVYREQFAQWSNLLDLRMQLLIVNEALAYLCHKAQRDVLRELVAASLYAWILAESACAVHKIDSNDIARREAMYNRIKITTDVQEPKDWDEAMVTSTRMLVGMTTEQYELIFYFIRDDVGQILSFINWADQFEKRAV